MPQDQGHASVLLNQSIDKLLVDDAGIYLDCTFGRGGHSKLILSRLGNEGRLIVMDRDPEAIAAANSLAMEDARLIVVSGNFNSLAEVARTHDIFGRVSGILFDLGVSSPQLDDAARGFSFMHDGPLDMRMDPYFGESASEWLNSAEEGEIAEVLKRYGEERFSRRMARAIVTAKAQQAITTTGQLAEIVKQANPAWEKGKHPATRAFQAIRIYINNELDALIEGLDQALEVLRVGGRMVIISFHSLEDRIVKKFITLQTKGDNFPRGVPVRQSDLKPRLLMVGKPTRAEESEVQFNPRARSAILRVAEKIA